MSFRVSFYSCVFSPFSIAITSLGEERANLSAFRTFVQFVLVWICRFPLPLGVWEGLRLVIVALPGLFSYLFFFWIMIWVPLPQLQFNVPFHSVFLKASTLFHVFTIVQNYCLFHTIISKINERVILVKDQTPTQRAERKKKRNQARKAEREEPTREPDRNQTPMEVGAAKKGKRKVQGVPQSQKKRYEKSPGSATITNRSPSQTPRGRGNRQIQTSTNVRKALILALSSPSEVIAILKGLKNTRTKRHTERHNTTNRLVE